MNKARLEWVMSGLNQYALTPAEDLFLKTASADFEKKQALTEQQEKRLETLYKEKSKLTPNRKTDSASLNETSPRKSKPRVPRTKAS